MAKEAKRGGDTDLAGAVLDPSDPDGKAAGLRGPSVIKTTNLYTIDQQDVHRIVREIKGLLPAAASA